MKKVLIILAIVLVVVFGLAPRLVGGRAQEHYEQMVDQWRSGGVQVVSTKYNRGWFGADAVTELVVPLPSAEELPQLPDELRFSLNSTLKHGPLTSLGGFGLAEVDTRIRLNGKQLFPEDYPARLRTVVALNGNTRTFLDLPPTTLPETDQRPRIDFQGLSGFVNVSAQFDRIDSRFESPGVYIAGGGIKQLTVGSFTLDSKAARGIAGLMLGEARIALSELRLDTVEQDSAIALNQLFIEGGSHADGELVAGSARYHIGTITIGTQQFKDAELKISAGNLSAQVLADIQSALDEIQSQRIDPEMQGTAIVSTLLTQVPLLLTHDPVIAVDTLQVDTADGRVEGRIKIQSRGLRVEDLQGDMGFITKFAAEAELKVPETIFRQLSILRTEKEIQRELQLRRELGEEVEVPNDAELQQLIADIAAQEIAALIEQRLLVREEQRLVTIASFQQGRLIVNGEVVELPFLPPAQ